MSTSVIFIFGLFHGLGFAGLLQDLQIPEGKILWSLLLFNVGTEVGQLLIIVPVFSLLLFLQKKSKWPEIHTTVAFAIACVGIVWGIQRIVS